MAFPSGANLDSYELPATLSAGGGTSAVASGAYSITADQAIFTIPENAREGRLIFSGVYTTGPANTGRIKYYLRRMGIDGANNEAIPSDEAQAGFVGSSSVATITGTQNFVIPINLIGVKDSQQYEFYLKNDTNQQLADAWTAKLVILAQVPKP